MNEIKRVPRHPGTTSALVRDMRGKLDKRVDRLSGPGGDLSNRERLVRRERRRGEAVSYTHLTLPTICSV
eukprot:3159041-Prorocentrum_lima.AAC.1